MEDPLQDNISRVELTASMGDDLMVVNGARVSYANYHEQFTEGDAKLIAFLASHDHWTPFGHPQLQFRMKMPIFIAREWYRHTVGLVRNEMSRRYVKTSPEYYSPTELRNPSATNKQGSEGLHHHSEVWTQAMDAEMQSAVQIYNEMIEDGVAAEQARTILPQSMYTEFIETGSLYAYSRICKLRITPEAMPETRAYAYAIDHIIAPLFPISWSCLSG